MVISYVSVMVFLQDDTTVTPAAVARVAWMAETILKKESGKFTMQTDHTWFTEFTPNSIEIRANLFAALLIGTNTCKS